jgi:hypothetical protein
MLFISTGIFDDKLRPQILSVVSTANSSLRFRTVDYYLKELQRTLVTIMPVKCFAPKVTETMYHLIQCTLEKKQDEL